MRKYILFIFFISQIMTLHAQKFAAPSQGYFNNEEAVKVVLADSTIASYAFDTSYILEETPDVFHLIDQSGNQVELEPDEILSIEINRGNEIFEEEEEEEELAEDEEYVDVIETTKVTERLLYERVPLTDEIGLRLKGDYKKDYMLLQLASVGLGDRLKVYICPNFEEGGTEVAPLGLEDDDVARNRVDYIAYQQYYFVRVGDKPAFKISKEEYDNLTPAIFGDCRPFRRKYGVGKEKRMKKW